MPDTAAPDTLSLTFNDAGRVLALVRITDNGDLFTRRADHWVAVKDEDRAIYDRTMHDISPEHYEEVTKEFDEHQIDMTQDSVKDFLAAV